MTAQAPGVTVGNAAKIASEVTALSFSTGVTFDNILPVYTEVLDGVLAAMAARTEDAKAYSPTPPAVQRVENAFPGTTVVAAPSNVVPAPQAAARVPQQSPQAQVPSPAGPAAVPGVSNGGNAQLEEAWNVFFNDINAGSFTDNWEDNRQKKLEGGKFANIPDFKHQSWQRPGEKYPVGLYISDKKNPAWVTQSLANVGIS
jgi:hypothetical protein